MQNSGILFRYTRNGRSNVPAQGFRNPNTSALEQGIGFNFGGQTLLDSPYDPNRLAPKAHVFGGLTPPCGDTTFANHVLSFAVFLKPISLWQLFGIPSNIMVNRDYDAENVLGRDVLELWSRLAECATFRQRIRAMEEYLLLFAARARARTLIMKAAQYMLRRKGAVRIDVIAFHAALSVRQFERRFAEEAGRFWLQNSLPKTARFQSALDAEAIVSEQFMALCVAHELGYFDQMHMIRDFRDWVAVRRTEYLRKAAISSRGRSRTVPGTWKQSGVEMRSKIDRDPVSRYAKQAAR